MQASLGLPLISMLHEPHLPALQFQRTARSLACSAWMRWMTSSTTMPSVTSTLYSTSSPPLLSPRQTRKRRSDIGLALQLLEGGVGDADQLGRPRRPVFDHGLHAPVLALADDHQLAAPLLALAREVVAGVGAAALLAHQRRLGHRL